MSTRGRFGRMREACCVRAKWLVRRERVRVRNGQVQVRSESILRTEPTATHGFASQPPGIVVRKLILNEHVLRFAPNLT